jgi:gamma-glutamyltranspeptidase/glutathione hydrolase
MPHRHFIAILVALTLAACAGGPGAGAKRALAAQDPIYAGGMSAAADPRAVDVANAILAEGGTATDAAIAAMMVLGLVEPQSAGVGGGGFLMHYAAKTEEVSAYDGREMAPAGAAPDMFLDEAGKPLAFPLAVTSGHSVGTPSLIAMLHMAHKEHGRLPWKRLFDPAIAMAEQGFVVSPRLAQWIQLIHGRGGPVSAEARAYLLTPEGQPKPAGVVIVNTAYAATLRAIAKDGPKVLQRGPIAEAIVAAARAEPRGGALTLADLAAYKPRAVTPLCGRFRVYRVCGMPPPSSGGVAVLEIISLFERARPKPAGPTDPDDVAAFLWASRLSYADRDHYLADDTFVPVPTYGLIAPAYLDARAKAIDLSKAAPGVVAPGDPAVVLGGESLLDRWGRETPDQSSGTTHLTVVDGAGNAVALTATVESLFGSQRMASGFFLNNQLTDFSLIPSRNGKPVANAVAPGKRPRSSMAPTIVMDADGDLVAALGSPGGSAIIGYVAKTVLGVTDWNLSMQEAITLPNFIARSGEVRAELKTIDPALAAALAARGWTLAPVTFEGSGVHGVQVTPKGLAGGADPRREGAARAAPAAPN